jgi:hypothetical protein
MNHTVNTGKSQKLLLACGIISSLLYIGTDIAASVHWRESYSIFSQAFSELLAYEAPTRPFVLSSSLLYNAIVIAFGSGVWVTAGRKLSLRVTAILLIGYAVVGIVTPTFFPAPMRGVEATARNIMHLPLTGIEVLFILSSIGFGAAAFGKMFRLYSIGSLLIITLCGFWSGTFVPNLAANQPTPWLGIIERGNIYGYMLWVMVLAIVLLRMEYNYELINNKITDASL